MRRQETPNGGRAIEPHVIRLKCDLESHFSCSENITSSESSRVRSVDGAENVTSTNQGVTRRQDIAWTTGRGLSLSLFAETSFSSRLGGLCTVPSSGVDRRSESTHDGGPSRDPRKRSQQVDRSSRRPSEASPKEKHLPRERGVAGEASGLDNPEQ